jgi:hypothetical protein
MMHPGHHMDHPMAAGGAHFDHAPFSPYGPPHPHAHPLAGGGPMPPLADIAYGPAFAGGYAPHHHAHPEHFQ